MLRTQTSDDELDRLMDRVRAEIADQDRRAAAASLPPPPGGPASAAKDDKRSFRLSNLLRRDGEAFVDACFRAVLGRAPEPGEAAYHRDRLRDGRLGKLELIEEMRFGPAGRARGVTIKGLAARRLLGRAGRLPGVATLVSLARLPRLASNVQRVRRQSEWLNEKVDRLPHSLSQGLAPVEAQLAAIGRELAGLPASIDGAVAELQARIEGAVAELRADRETALQRLPGFVDERLQAGQIRLERLVAERLSREREELAGRLGQIDRRLTALSVAVERSNAMMAELGERQIVVQRAIGRSAPAGEAVAPAATEGASADGGDALYAAFEDCFRGSREDIRQRQATHLPLVTAQAPALAALPVLDLGCGRGEWLDLLRERAIAAVGVDRNRVFVADNLARGLEVVEADALAHLRGLPDRALRAVTGFHVIEHLPFPVLLALLDESLRVLAEGGLLLLETPNPENLVTAAHRFYSDPTHRHPIPPDLAAFLLRARGFRDVAVRRLHENKAAARDGVADEVVRELLFGPQDYAVVGYR